MKTLFGFLGGFFQDQRGNSSSKRLILFVFTFYYFLILKDSQQTMLVNGIVAGKPVNELVFYGTIGVILFCLGAVTSEILAKFLGGKGKDPASTEN